MVSRAASTNLPPYHLYDTCREIEVDLYYRGTVEVVNKRLIHINIPLIIFFPLFSAGFRF